jgi:hypothetical protein
MPVLPPAGSRINIDAVGDPTDEDCVICLEKLANGVPSDVNNIVWNDCPHSTVGSSYHAFHRKCVQAQIDSGYTSGGCPTCRAKWRLERSLYYEAIPVKETRKHKKTKTSKKDMKRKVVDLVDDSDDDVVIFIPLHSSKRKATLVESQKLHRSTQRMRVF